MHMLNPGRKEASEIQKKEDFLQAVSTPYQNLISRVLKTQNKYSLQVLKEGTSCTWWQVSQKILSQPQPCTKSTSAWIPAQQLFAQLQTAPPLSMIL